MCTDIWIVLLVQIEQKEARAHCDIPCAVYDPAEAQYSALSVLRFLDLIGEMPDNIQSKKDLAHLSRLVQQKEEHAAEVKDAVRTIWGDYFKIDLERLRQTPGESRTRERSHRRSSILRLSVHKDLIQTQLNHFPNWMRYGFACLNLGFLLFFIS